MWLLKTKTELKSESTFQDKTLILFSKHSNIQLDWKDWYIVLPGYVLYWFGKRFQGRMTNDCTTYSCTTSLRTVLPLIFQCQTAKGYTHIAKKTVVCNSKVQLWEKANENRTRRGRKNWSLTSAHLTREQENLNDLSLRRPRHISIMSQAMQISRASLVGRRKTRQI